jgi:hypothetical protein
MVKAKFKVQYVTHFEFSKVVEMNAIYGTEGENADFTKATPNGNLTITISNDVPASELFNPGDEFYLNFDKIQK